MVPPNHPTNQDGEILWQQALANLRLLLTQATFNSWLAGTHALAAQLTKVPETTGDSPDSQTNQQTGTLVIGLHSQAAKEWVENRLLSRVQQALLEVGYHGAVLFAVAPPTSANGHSPPPLSESFGSALLTSAPLQPDQVAVQFVEFNLLERGWLRTPSYYDLFWQPIMGHIAYAFWRYQQVTNFTSGAFTRERVIDIGRAAAHLGVHREVLKGPQPGQCGAALGRLVELGLGAFVISGQGSHMIYRGKVRRRLPLLTPAQVAMLSEQQQEDHARWLVDAGFDLDAWFALDEAGIRNLGTLTPSDPAYVIAQAFIEPDWDSPRVQAAGFLMTPSYYDLFLQPLIGSIGYALWRLFKCLFYNPGGPFTHERVVTVAHLASYLACDRQKITGCRRNRDGHPVWQEGAFDLLRREHVAAIREEGQSTRKGYRIRVVNTPAMLTPRQAEHLSPLLQQAHDDWLERARLDLHAWQQLEMESLLEEV
jgi:hypothetical protein